ncbi:hypothetical protein M569_02551 [Genlisea aurea]|uniref:HMA domain-containing protein n=1 Tax=Genlisea aurea TaxID=192259 RepID=S8CXL9_9LAMI|nr:hypothetical protein M569_02551 [Genlisea aurea]
MKIVSQVSGVVKEVKLKRKSGEIILRVIGDGIDAVHLTSLVRKKFPTAELVTLDLISSPDYDVMQSSAVAAYPADVCCMCPGMCCAGHRRVCGLWLNDWDLGRTLNCRSNVYTSQVHRAAGALGCVSSSFTSYSAADILFLIDADKVDGHPSRCR